MPSNWDCLRFFVSMCYRRCCFSFELLPRGTPCFPARTFASQGFFCSSRPFYTFVIVNHSYRGKGKTWTSWKWKLEAYPINIWSNNAVHTSNDTSNMYCRPVVRNVFFVFTVKYQKFRWKGAKAIILPIDEEVNFESLFARECLDNLPHNLRGVSRNEDKVCTVRVYSQSLFLARFQWFVSGNGIASDFPTYLEFFFIWWRNFKFLRS